MSLLTISIWLGNLNHGSSLLFHIWKLHALTTLFKALVILSHAVQGS